jgi:L-histidine Nalpha-methyltransferase
MREYSVRVSSDLEISAKYPPMQARDPNEVADSRVQFLIRSTEDPLGQDGPNVIAGLSQSPKRISSVYVYDKRGTELFERQCETPEYYLRRVESQLLTSFACEIVDTCGLLPLVELGAGTAEKTRLLLLEYAKRGSRCDYFPIDVDSATLFKAASELTSDFPQLFVHCLGTTYEKGLATLPPSAQSRLFLFLGSSLGNMERPEIDRLLSRLFDSGAHGDYLLVGADLNKDPAVIDKAYNDSAGYGPRSTLNILDHLNRRYGGNFAQHNFRYRSRYDSLTRRNEVRIESLRNQTVTLSSLNFSVSLRAAELIDAEVMWKFDPQELVLILDRAGFSLVRQWIDLVYRYGLFLLRRQ